MKSRRSSRKPVRRGEPNRAARHQIRKRIGRKRAGHHGDGQSGTGILGFCPSCGAVLRAGFILGDECPACREPVDAALSHPPDAGLVTTPDVSAVLDAAILEWARKGYSVVRQGQGFAEMRKLRRFSAKWAAAWTIAGIPLPGLALAYAGGYAIWHAVRREKSICLVVESDGTLRTEDSGQ